MRKRKIFYPNLLQKGGFVTEDEYERQLVNHYREKYPNLSNQFYIDVFISRTLYNINFDINPSTGCFPNALVAVQNSKKLSLHDQEYIIKFVKSSRGLSSNFYVLTMFYQGNKEYIKYNMEKMHMTYSDEYALIAQEITKKIIDDVEVATRSQLTFAQRLTHNETKRSNNNKRVSWADEIKHNRASESLESQNRGQRALDSGRVATTSDRRLSDTENEQINEEEKKSNSSLHPNSRTLGASITRLDEQGQRTENKNAESRRRDSFQRGV